MFDAEYRARERADGKRIRGFASSRQGVRGFTLLEMTAALFVMSVGLLGVAQMYHVGVTKLRAHQETRLVVQAVENEVETLRALPFAALENTEAGPFRSKTEFLKPLARVSPTIMISDWGRPELRMKQVAAQVTWIGENGRRITKSLTTVVADKGVYQP